MFRSGNRQISKCTNSAMLCNVTDQRWSHQRSKQLSSLILFCDFSVLVRVISLFLARVGDCKSLDDSSLSLWVKLRAGLRLCEDESMRIRSGIQDSLLQLRRPQRPFCSSPSTQKPSHVGLFFFTVVELVSDLRTDPGF